MAIELKTEKTEILQQCLFRFTENLSAKPFDDTLLNENRLEEVIEKSLEESRKEFPENEMLDLLLEELEFDFKKYSCNRPGNGWVVEESWITVSITFKNLGSLELVGDLSLGGIVLSFDLVFPGDGTPRGRIVGPILRGTLFLGTKGELTVSAGLDKLEFTGYLDAREGMGIEDIVSVVSGGGIDLPDTLKIQSAGFGFSPPISRYTLDMDILGSIDLEIAEISNIRLGFDYWYGLKGSFEGSLAIAGVDIAVRAKKTATGWSIEGATRDRIMVNDLFSLLQAPDLDSFKDLYIDFLRLKIEKAAQNCYEFEFTLDGSWQPFDGFTLDRLSFFIEKTGGAVVFQARGCFEVGGVSVSADLASTVSGGKKGWRISAFTNERVDFDQLFSLFSITGVELPSTDGIIPDITALSIDYNTASKDYEFGFSLGDLAIGSVDFKLKELDAVISKGDKSISGRCAFGSLDLDLSAEDGGLEGWTFQGTTEPGDSIPLGTLLEDLAAELGIDSLVPDALESVALEDLEVSFNTRKGEYFFSGDTTFELFDTDIAISLNVGAVKKPGGGYDKKIQGIMQLGPVSFTASFDSKTENKGLSASWKAEPGEDGISLEELIGVIGLGTPDIPDSFDITLVSAAFSYDSANKLFLLEGETEAKIKILFVGRGSKGTQKGGSALGIALPGDWTLSRVWDELAFFDFIELKAPKIVLSSFDDPQFELAALDAGVSKGIVKGANVYTQMALSGGILGHVSDMIHLDDIDIHLGIASPVKNSFIEASLGDSMTIIGDLELSDPRIEIKKSDPVSVAVAGNLAVNLGDTRLVFQGRLIYSTTNLACSANLDAGEGNLIEPMGFKGVTLQEIGLSLAMPLPARGTFTMVLAGEFALKGQPPSSNAFAMGFEVIANVVSPVLLSCKFDELTLGILFKAVMDGSISFPGILEEIKFNDVYLYWCRQPTILPNGETCLPGFGFSGEMDFFGWHAGCSVAMDFNSAMKGEAWMDPINLGSVLSISGKGRNGGPFVEFNTISSPFFKASMDVDLLGLASVDTYGEIADDGFTFRLSSDLLGCFKRDISCVLDGTDSFKAETTMFVGIDFSIEAKIPGTDISAGTLTIEGGFEGGVAIEITRDSFLLEIKGYINAFGEKIPVPGSFKITQAFTDITDLPDMVVDFIIDNAYEIFKDFLLNPANWAKLIAQGIIKGIENLAKFLMESFDLVIEQAAALMKNVAGYTKKAIGEAFKQLGYAAEEVLDALEWVYDEVINPEQLLKALDYTVDQVMAAVKYVGYTAEYVADFLVDLYGYTKEMVMKALKYLGYAADQVFKAMKQVFNLAAEALVTLMKQFEYAIDAIAKGLREFYNMSAEAIGKALKLAGYAVEAIAAALKNAFNYTAEMVGEVLKYLGYGVEVLMDALEWVYDEVLNPEHLLKALGYSKEVIMKTLKYVGYASEYVINALVDGYNYIAEETVAFLKDIGYNVRQVADGFYRILKGSYAEVQEKIMGLIVDAGYAAREIAEGMETVYRFGKERLTVLLKQFNYGAEAIADAMNSAYEVTADQIAMVLRNAEFAVEEVGEALGYVYGKSEKVVAHALKYAGYAVEEVGDFLKDTWDLGNDVVRDALGAAGYAAEDIKDLFVDVWGYVQFWNHF